MYILLKNTDDLNDKGFYIKTKRYDRDIEKILIELYYRGIAEGLVENFEKEVSDYDLKVIEIDNWLKDKKYKVIRKKEKDLILTLSNKLKEVR